MPAARVLVTGLLVTGLTLVLPTATGTAGAATRADRWVATADCKVYERAGEEAIKSRWVTGRGVDSNRDKAATIAQRDALSKKTSRETVNYCRVRTGKG